MLARADLPCPFQTVIPFLSLLVKDIHFLNEGCASRLPNGHVNFEVGPGAQGSARTSQLRQQECWPGHSSPQGQAGGSPHPHPPQETGAPTGEVLTGGTGRSAGGQGRPPKEGPEQQEEVDGGQKGHKGRSPQSAQVSCPPGGPWPPRQRATLQNRPGIPWSHCCRPRLLRARQGCSALSLEPPRRPPSTHGSKGLWVRG